MKPTTRNTARTTANTVLICTKCRNIVDVGAYTSATGELESIDYRHAQIHLDAWHEPTVALVPRKEAKLVCDFCTKPDPKWAFVLAREFELELGVKRGKYNVVKGYSTPWSCCDSCKGVVSEATPAELVEYMVHSSGSKTAILYKLSSNRVKRGMAKKWEELYQRFYDNEPQGPFPIAEV